MRFGPGHSQQFQFWMAAVGMPAARLMMNALRLSTQPER
jgi:hypothetical protein